MGAEGFRLVAAVRTTAPAGPSWPRQGKFLVQDETRSVVSGVARVCAGGLHVPSVLGSQYVDAPLRGRAGTCWFSIQDKPPRSRQVRVLVTAT